MLKRFRFFAIPLILVISVSPFIFLGYDNLLRFTYRFLNVTDPVNGNVLIIEGWLSGKVLIEAAREFKKGDYSFCLITGKAFFLPSAMNMLHKQGISLDSIRFVESDMKSRHRTYHMALAARNWLRENDQSIKAVNIFTGGPHGRKSWVIFRRVFGKEYSVGIISSKTWFFNPNSWWESKRGIRSVGRYGVGYLYGLLWPFKT